MDTIYSLYLFITGSAFFIKAGKTFVTGDYFLEKLWNFDTSIKCNRTGDMFEMIKKNQP